MYEIKILFIEVLFYLLIETTLLYNIQFKIVDTHNAREFEGWSLPLLSLIIFPNLILPLNNC